MDALVAEQVMGWKKGNYKEEWAEGSREYFDVWIMPEGEWPKYRRKVPMFSRLISAAWFVVEKVGKDGEGLFDLMQHRNNWEAVVSVPTGSFRANAPTAPEVICLAALKAMAKVRGE